MIANHLHLNCLIIWHLCSWQTFITKANTFFMHSVNQHDSVTVWATEMLIYYYAISLLLNITLQTSSLLCFSPVSPDTEQRLSCPPPAAVQSAPNPPQKPEKQLCFWEHHLQPLSWKPQTGAGRPARWETGGRSGTEQAGRSAAGRCGSSRTHAAAHRGASLPHGRLVWRAPAGEATSPAPTPDWEHV